MKRLKSVFLLFLFFLLAFLSFGEQRKITIKFSPPVGTKMNYTLNSVIQASGFKLSGIGMSLGASAKGSLNMEVIRTNANNIYTEITSDDLIVTLQTPIDTRRLDLSTVNGKALKVVFDRTGSVNEVQNLNAVQTQNIMNFSIIQILRNYFPSFSSNPVATGDTWTDHRRMQAPFQGMNLNILLNVRYTLQSVYSTQFGEEASISADYAVTLLGKRTTANGEATFSGKGTGSGYLHFLASKGYFTEYRLDYSIKSDLVLKSKKGKVLTTLPIEMSVTASLDLDQ